MADIPLHMLDMAHRLTISSPGRKPTERLADASDDLIRAAQDVEAQTYSVKDMILNAGSGPVNKVSTMSMLGKKAIKLTGFIERMQDSLKAMQEQSEAYIVAQIMHLGKADDSDMDVQSMIRHHRDNIKAIIRKHLKNDSNTDDRLWRIVEECYSQAVKAKGCLRSLPPRIRSNTTDVEMRQYWVAFWRRALHHCPGGPTLFWPWMSSDLRGKTIAPSKYLFRAFDPSSYGQNNSIVVASPASMNVARDESRIDIRSLSEQEGTDKLYLHSDSQHRSRAQTDNLMSWSSSLLFVIQLAIYMNSVTGYNPNNVKILAVDTTKFPPGQFARDLDLFEAFSSAESGVPSMKAMVNWRTSGAFDNGEYFSQGLLNHKGRSCLTSLGELIDDRLFDLHPEFDDPSGSRKWTTRVKQLRRKWAQRQESHRLEIEWAFDIAKRCFAGFKTYEVAMLLLTFVNRGGSAGDEGGSLQDMEKYGPLEVQRYRQDFGTGTPDADDVKRFFGCETSVVVDVGTVFTLLKV